MRDVVPEGEQLDYKKELPPREKLKTNIAGLVSAFANTNGGVILFGVEEQVDEDGANTGEPKQIVGLKVNIDGALQQISQVLTDYIRPRVQEMAVEEIKADGKSPLIAIRVGRSSNAPHMLLKNAGTETGLSFYRRRGRDKQPQDWQEIREMYARSIEMRERHEEFRRARLIEIAGSNCGLKVLNRTTIVSHVIPVSFREGVSQIDIDSEYENFHKNTYFTRRPRQRLVTFDGLVGMTRASDGCLTGYCTLYREGIVESVWAGIVLGEGDDAAIRTPQFEEEILGGVFENVQRIRDLGVTGPVLIGISMARIKQSWLVTPFSPRYPEAGGTDRKSITCPAVVYDNSGCSREEINEAMRPTMDIIWNTYGYPKCLLYDEENGLYDKNRRW
ncbi:ATP-binding protein [Planctomycetota bacterium]|nr:ATP-binding protein [Planctomycetota bacterium]